MAVWYNPPQNIILHEYVEKAHRGGDSEAHHWNSLDEICFYLGRTSSRWKDRGTQSGHRKCIFVEIFVGFYANTDTSCIDYLHYLRKKYVPMHKHTQIRLNVALQCPYYDNVSFKYGKKKKTYISPWAYHDNAASDKTEKESNQLDKEAHADIFRVTYTLVSSWFLPSTNGVKKKATFDTLRWRCSHHHTVRIHSSLKWSK